MKAVEVIAGVISKQNRELYFQNCRDKRHGEQVVQGLRAQVAILAQGSHDITTNTDDDSDATNYYTGLPYTTYTKQVNKIDQMYRNRAPWGNMIAKNVIDIRAAFSTGQGLQVVKNENFTGDATRELDFIRNFMELNNLDIEMPQEYAKEVEIEGRVLFKFAPAINWDGKRDNNIQLEFVPWRRYNYKIHKAKNNPYNAIRAEYTSTGPKFDLDAPKFVYRGFGGNPYQDETPSKMAFCIGHAQNLDKALWDWREINKIHASPTPVISVDDREEMKRVVDYIDGKNWKVGKTIVLHNGKFELVGWHGEGYTTIKEEIEVLVKTLSGTTGIPVHFFGYPELLSNRDTAESLIELIVLATNKERTTWISAYEEVFKKAIGQYNAIFFSNLDPNAVSARMPFVSAGKMEEIANVWLPMYLANTISLQTFLGQLSGDIEIDDEIVRIKAGIVEKQKNAKLLESNSASNVNAGDRGVSGSEGDGKGKTA